MKHIFLVDDSMLLNMALDQFLRSEGYRTTMLPSGEECLEALAGGEAPDIILMDINFGPGRLNGPDTTKRVLETADIPVVLHSAYTDKATLDMTKEMTRYGYIKKQPGNEQFILANIEMALQLHASKKLYKELFQNSNDAIFLHTLNDAGMPNTFFEVNDVACSSLGYTREELLTMGPGDIDTQPWDNVLSEVIRTLDMEKRITFEREYTTKDGRIVPVEISARQFIFSNQPTVISSVRDIGERRRIEKDLRESEALHRTTLSSMSDTVFLTDDSGQFIFVCPNVHVIFGCTEDEVREFGTIDALFGSLLISSAELDTVNEQSNIECLIRDKNGAPHTLLVTVKRVAIKSASRLYTCRDISELTEKEKDLKKSEKMYRELSAHLQNVREEQNAYIAREIHDDLGQSITALKMNLTMIENILKKKDGRSGAGPVLETTRDMTKILNGIVTKIRALTTELRPPALDTFGLFEALKGHIADFEKQFGISVRFDPGREEAVLDEEKSLTVFRIVQEALTNSVRHGTPSLIEVTAEGSDTEFTLTISDNGTGFSPDAVDKGKKFGLIGMVERARQSGGSLDINSTPCEGTSVVLRFSLRAE